MQSASLSDSIRANIGQEHTVAMNTLNNRQTLDWKEIKIIHIVISSGCRVSLGSMADQANSIIVVSWTENQLHEWTNNNNMRHLFYYARTRPPIVVTTFAYDLLLCSCSFYYNNCIICRFDENQFSMWPPVQVEDKFDFMFTVTSLCARTTDNNIIPVSLIQHRSPYKCIENHYWRSAAFI